MLSAIYFWPQHGHPQAKTVVDYLEGSCTLASTAIHPTFPILQDVVRHMHQETGVEKAVSQLIHIPSLQEFYKSLKPKKAEYFTQHLRIYVDIYLLDCPFEVLSRNRYTKSIHEATITTRRFIGKREVIKYLCGTQVRLTSKEKAELGDHSSLYRNSSSRAALPGGLGPIRYLREIAAEYSEGLSCS
jgi:hypothetical protein